MQLFLSCHAMLLPKKWLFTFELHFLSKLFYQPTKWPIIYQQIFCAKNEPLFYGGAWQRRHPTAGFCFAFINMESKDWIFLRQNWKAYLGLKLLPSKCTMLVEKSWISKFSIAEIFFWQETADFYQISISIFIRSCQK